MLGLAPTTSAPTAGEFGGFDVSSGRINEFEATVASVFTTSASLNMTAAMTGNRPSSFAHNASLNMTANMEGISSMTIRRSAFLNMTANIEGVTVSSTFRVRGEIGNWDIIRTPAPGNRWEVTETNPQDRWVLVPRASKTWT